MICEFYVITKHQRTYSLSVVWKPSKVSAEFLELVASIDVASVEMWSVDPDHQHKMWSSIPTPGLPVYYYFECYTIIMMSLLWKIVSCHFSRKGFHGVPWCASFVVLQLFHCLLCNMARHRTIELKQAVFMDTIYWELKFYAQHMLQFLLPLSKL